MRYRDLRWNLHGWFALWGVEVVSAGLVAVALAGAAAPTGWRWPIVVGVVVVLGGGSLAGCLRASVRSEDATGSVVVRNPFRTHGFDVDAVDVIGWRPAWLGERFLAVRVRQGQVGRGGTHRWIRVFGVSFDGPLPDFADGRPVVGRAPRRRRAVQGAS